MANIQEELEQRFWKARWATPLALWVGRALLVFTAFFIVSWLIALHLAGGIRVEPFSVPADLERSDLTGEAAAKLLVAKLHEAYAVANSAHYVQSLNDNSADEIKIEIPETGTTFGDLNRYLRDQLGHETHVSGVVYNSGGDVKIAAVVGDKTCVAPLPDDDNPDLDSMMGEVADCVLLETQPYLYANYRAKKPEGTSETDLRDAEVKARHVYQDLTNSTDPLERAWAYAGLGDGIAKSAQGNRDAIRYGIGILRQATGTLPDFAVAEADIATYENELGHDEAAAAAQTAYRDILRRRTSPDLGAAVIANRRGPAEAELSMQIGDFGAAARAYAGADCYDPDPSCESEIVALAYAHDTKRAQALLALRQPALQWDPESTNDSDCRDASVADPKLTNLQRWNLDNAQFAFFIAGAAEDWNWVLAEQAEARESYYSERGCRLSVQINIEPIAAVALAMRGRFEEAIARIGHTPDDCYECMIARGRIYASHGDMKDAERWLKAAADSGTLLPFADQAWGEVLLDKGLYDPAIDKFAIAHRRSPHYADALEKWGEALMKQNRSHYALIRFEQANEFAPNWGRLHLKWGEALYYSGHSDLVQAQLDAAAALDLSAADGGELSWDRKHMGARHG